MQFSRIDLLGFRQLVNRSFDFEPGLNLIYGPNEAGKSTLMEAIAILLYGFFDVGRVSLKEREALDQYKPWLYLGGFGGTLTYRLGNGEVLQIQRIFAPEISTTLTRLSDHRNLTDKFRNDSDGRVYFAEEQLGISKSVFENVCVIRQSELALLEQSATPIAETIMRLSSTMTADGSTVNEALAVLESTFKQKVGTPRAHSKPLVLTKKRVEQLGKAIVDAKATRKGSWQILTSVNTGEADIIQLQKRYLDCHILLLRARLSDTQETLGRVWDLEREEAEARQKVVALQKWQIIGRDLYDQLLSLDARRKSLEVELESAEQDLPEKLVTLEKEQQELVAQIESFNVVPAELIERMGTQKNEIDKAAQAVAAAQRQVEKLEAEVDEAQAVVETLSREFPYVVSGHSALATIKHQYRAVQNELVKSQASLAACTAEWKRANLEESAFLALKDTPVATQRKKGCKPLTRKVSSVQPLPSELVIYNDLLPIYTRWKNAQVSLKETEQQKADLEAAIRRDLLLKDGPVEAKAFDHTSTKIDEYLKSVTTGEIAIRNLADAKSALEEAEGILKSLEGKLNELLPAGISRDQDIEGEHQQMQKLRQRLVDIETQIERLRAENSKWQAKNEEYQRVLQELNDLYKEARIDEVLSMDEKLLSYRAEREKQLEWQNADREARAVEQRLQEFPFQSKKLIQQAAELEQQLQTLVEQAPYETSLTPVETADHYQREFEKLQQQLQEVRQSQIRMNNEASRASESMVDLASLMEEHADAAAELKRLEWFGEALQTAQSELAKAATSFQRQFTPRLQAYLNSGLSHATGGRYTQSLVDPETLVVKLLAPETQRWIHVDQLSTGTRDLVYLLLRFSIARLMSSSGEQLPMLLDDPFVHCDRSRKTNILSFLISQASDMQFILFTQDDWTLSWLNANYPHCNMAAMSYDENTSIDYALVGTLTDQSEALRERLLAVEESDDGLRGSLGLPDTILSSVKDETESVWNIVNVSEKLVQDVSVVLSSDETAIRILALLERCDWETPESDVQSILDGQFLGVVLDSLNSRALDVLGDQLVYVDSGRLVVTEEFRPSLRQFLKQG